jgi:hexosaminidase
MLRSTPFLMVVLTAWLSGCTGGTSGTGVSAGSPAQADLQAIADNLHVNYRVIENRGGGHCPGSDGPDPCFVAALTFRSSVPIAASGWEIYFSQVDPVAQARSDEFIVEHINGDLHRITPSNGFTGFSGSEAKVIEMTGRGLVLTETKLMPNYYVVADGLEPRVVASTRVSVDPETGLEVRPYVTPLTDPAQFKSHPEDKTQWATSKRQYADNQALTFDPGLVDTAIVPTPKQMTVGEGRLDLSPGLSLQLQGVQRSTMQPALERLALLGIMEAGQGVPVQVAVTGSGKPESYQLNIGAERVDIEATDEAGALYALQSLAALLVPGRTDVPRLSVVDEPRYRFRGLHLDVARNFHSKGLVLKILDQMAAYKLNKLHLHLGDDEGWRLEINGLPELTAIGGKRCHDPQEDTCLLPQLGSGPHGNSQVDGYFTIADYQELLKAASARNIQVIPSFDMPGHSRAVIKAMEARYRKYMALGQEEEAKRYLLSDLQDKTQYESIQFYSDNTINVCMESTYAFISRVMDEMQAVHRAVGQPLTLYHIGADETAGAWVESPACHAFLANNSRGVKHAEELGGYFIERVANLLAEKGIRAAGWNDGMGETRPENMPTNVQSNLWALLGSEGHKIAHQHANYGWDVVLSTPDVLYFDFPPASDPKEHGYYWGSRKTTARDVFEFMPDNLPVHAEFRTDQRGHAYVADDRPQQADKDRPAHEPLAGDKAFVGIQGHVWSETLRSDALVEYMLFPRMITLAERAWHKPGWAVPYDYEGALYSHATNFFTPEKRAQRDQAWNQFANVLAQKVMPKLDAADVQYRLPTVGAVLESGVLKANTEFPGLVIEYRVNGGDWERYDGPVKVHRGRVEVRTVAPDGKRKGRSLRL